MRRLITAAFVTAGTIAASVMFLSGTSPARVADSEYVPPYAQQLARMICGK
jgi:hypothetical protein